MQAADPVQISAEDGYRLFRGKCREMSEQAVQADPTLTLVRGFYFCPIWNTEEPHWWCTRPDGTIVDPTAAQFPSKGLGLYREFDGMVACAECGTEVSEADATLNGRYGFCSTRCACAFVGISCS